MIRIFIALITFISIYDLKGNDDIQKRLQIVDRFELDLNQDGVNDSIVLEQEFYINVVSGEKFYDPGDFHKITFVIDNKRIVRINEEGWVKMNLRHQQGDSLFNIETDLFFTLRLSDDRIGFGLNTYPYASDPDKFTIFSISKESEVETVYDWYFYITRFEDLNSDGIKEIVGPIDYYGQVNPDNTFVPFRVYRIGDAYEVDENLSFEYNLNLKKYRDFPEGTIKVISEEELRKYDKNTLRIMRNEIYADYGYIFKSEDLRTYFESKSWYIPRISSAEKITFTYLTEYEKKNIELIRKLERE